MHESRVLPRILLTYGAAAAVGVLVGWWTPRGPVTSAQALTTMALGLAVGLVAGVVLRSRWALLVAPVALVASVELTRLGATGPTVDAIDLSGFFGIGAFAVGRLFHGLVLLAPLALGVLLGRSWALRQRGHPAPSRVRRAGALTLSLLLVLLAVGFVRPATTEPILGADGEPLAGSVAELARVQIGGHEQTMLVRGRSTNNPVLLFLAGGPGGFEIGTMSRHARLLEQDFVVVTWDQRGTGASYAGFDPAGTLTAEQAVADTIEVAEHLLARFDERQVYVLGNSYGTLLGALAAQQRPDLVAALVGAGQMVSIRETDELFYDDTLAHAERAGDTALVATLRENGPPPYADPAKYLPMVNGEHLWNDWSHVYGDQGRREPVDNLLVPEYSLVDQVRSLTGLVDTYARLYPQLQELDLRTDVPRLEVPVYLVQGRYEARGRAVLAEQWFGMLDAPLKQLVTFERSGHRPFVQEPERMHAFLTGTVLRNTAPDRVLVQAAGPAEQPDELIALFTRYNPAVWPAQLVAYALVLLALWRVVRRPGQVTDRLVTGLLAGMWLWLGVVFHGRYGAQLAPGLEAVYGTLFVLQAGLLARAGWRGRLVLTRGRGVAGRLAWLTLGYALVAYPLLGALLGHGYPEAPLLGVAPCPSVIATFGLLLLVRPPLPRHLLAVPLLWAVLAPLAAMGRGLLEDVGLLVLGVLATVVLLVRDRHVQGAGAVVPAQREPDSASLVTSR